MLIAANTRPINNHPLYRTEHLYAFFIQWSPETYAEDTGECTREPGFIVVKKIEESDANEDPAADAAAREWEVRVGGRQLGWLPLPCVICGLVVLHKLQDPLHKSRFLKA